MEGMAAKLGKDYSDRALGLLDGVDIGTRPLSDQGLEWLKRAEIYQESKTNFMGKAPSTQRHALPILIVSLITPFRLWEKLKNQTFTNSICNVNALV